jgi:hypothetical protein
MKSVKVDGRMGATVKNTGCDAIVWVKDGRVMKEDFL